MCSFLYPIRRDDVVETTKLLITFLKTAIWSADAT